MPLVHEPDVSHADWFARSDADWRQLCSIGPGGFTAYARVLHPTEPPHGPQELLNAEGDLPDEELRALCEVLASHTSTPGDCFFGLWDGFDLFDPSPVLSVPQSFPRLELPAALDAALREAPRVRIPARDYLLFRGPLAQAGDWGATEYPPELSQLGPHRINSPNLIWPADRAWFVATEIDLPWTGVGGSAALVRDLLGAPALDVVPARASPGLPYAREGSPFRPG
ncbi:MAG: hypothetical protein ABWX73_12220 [Marmoricola sp.]